MTTQTQSGTYYHVAGEHWSAGDPLLCWDRLREHDIETVWKWDDAPVGYDGDVVCLFDTWDEAAEFLAELGGTLVIVTVPDEIDGNYPLPWYGSGYISPRMTQVAEGYTAIADGIPAEWIALA